ncbi:MAG: 3-dehydroquinate synthase [Deltaproteobacteria bacterium]|nr:MAG: 3-dehydroquinate synthase [Deltaproteobacteria bacterium]
MESVDVHLAERSYSILINSDSLASLGQELSHLNFPKRVAVISNPTVDNLYGSMTCTSLETSGFIPTQFNIPDGENYKSITTLESIYDFLIENEFDRGCGLIALGGGVIGDIAGFAAATFLRGIPYVQVPTTLLAQVDSSVGGKTAINHPLGKNLIGAFYQPEMVFIDITTLNTLEPRDLSAGMAEVIKYGVICDSNFFCWLEDNIENLKNRKPESIVYAIRRSCQLKGEIVARDEREGSVRAFLNYGHTFGHAIEKLSGYGQFKHGEAVAIGMVVAARIAAGQGFCLPQEVQRLSDLLSAFDLPIDPPDFSLEEYVVAMQRDKKVKQGHLTMVLNRGIGECFLHQVDDISAVFSPFVKHL